MSPNDPTLQEAQPEAPADTAGTNGAATETAAPLQASAQQAQAVAQPAPAVAQPAPADASPPTAAADPGTGGAEPPAQGGERPRVTLNPSGPQDAKAIPTLQGGEEPAAPQVDYPDLKDTPASAEPKSIDRPIAVSGIEIPRSAELDPEVEAELAAAMSGNALSAEINRKAAEAGPPQPMDLESLQPGTRLKGTIQLVGEETVFVDLGMRSPGMIQAKQFSTEKPAVVGQPVDVVVDNVDVGEGAINVSLPKSRRKPGGNWDAVAKGQVVDAMVAKTNKGGLEVTIGGLRGFLPASQVDLGFVENLESYVGQKLTCVITEVNPQKRNLVLSRRAFLQTERQEKEKELWTTLSVGQSMTGTVKTVKDYGAFVDLGGVDGFLHVGEISWNRVNHPSDILKVGDVIQVKILKLDAEAKKIGLGMKQLAQNPWGSIESKYPVGGTVSGKVTRTTDFGAFVELEQGVEGLIHISELDHKRIGRVTDVVKEGDQVDAKVLAVEPSRKRISLSLKALKSKPEAERAPEPPVQPYERKHKGPLRGGRETGGGSGLFGNPDDFNKR